MSLRVLFDQEFSYSLTLASRTTKVAIKQVQKSKDPVHFYYLFKLCEMNEILALKDSNIVRFYGCNYDGHGSLTVFMEPMHESLVHVINRKKTNNQSFKIDEIILLIIAVIKGVDYLHSKKLIHGDLRPSHVLVNEDHSIVKLSSMKSSSFLHLVQPHMFPPEFCLRSLNQLEKVKLSDPHIDIWQIGLLISELVVDSLYSYNTCPSGGSSLSGGQAGGGDSGGQGSGGGDRDMMDLDELCNELSFEDNAIVQKYLER